MKNKWILLMMAYSIMMILFGYAGQEDFPVLKGPYLGQKPPGMTPDIFAPGFVSTEKYGE